MIPKYLTDLIDALRILPGVGAKTAERYALHLLDMDEVKAVDLAQSILDAHSQMMKCSICHMLSDQNICSICQDSSRQKNMICVVPSVKEVITIEKTGQYQGVYHVLEGLISTQKGILPEDINIESLMSRANDSVSEVILGLNATMEGEMTALYIAKRLESKVQVTRLAFGLSIGGQLDYADDMTLLKAFEGRQKVK